MSSNCSDALKNENCVKCHQLFPVLNKRKLCFKCSIRNELANLEVEHELVACKLFLACYRTAVKEKPKLTYLPYIWLAEEQTRGHLSALETAVSEYDFSKHQQDEKEQQMSVLPDRDSRKAMQYREGPVQDSQPVQVSPIFKELDNQRELLKELGGKLELLFIKISHVQVRSDKTEPGEPEKEPRSPLCPLAEAIRENNSILCQLTRVVKINAACIQF